ncbi:MAG TPA: PAS domain S-box protein [Anaerolineaceae bacterium]|nr:PAS domain S-box protein [Anaerolineaceae bacterium]HPN53241.1 PAS domain S-box protein [Anaerolineaceae bacterium]
MEQVPSANAPFTNVVVVNDDITQLNVLCGLLRKAGLKPVPFQSAEAALAQMKPEQPPALIVTDLYMPGIDGWRFCRLLRSSEYPPFNQIPILVVSSIFSGDEPSRIASELGANAFLSMTAGGQVFIQRVQDLLKGRESGEILRVLLVEPDQQLLDSLIPAFQSHGCRVDAAATFREASENIEQSDYDVAVLGVHLPDGTGEALLNALRCRTPGCVCLMTTVTSQPERALEWMKMGAAAYLQKPFDAQYLVSQCKRVRREQILLQVKDELTERTRQLQESENLFRDIFEKHAAVKLLIDPETGMILDANQAAATFYGWSKEQLKRMRIQDINILSPEEIQHEMRRAATLQNIHFEFRHRRADGSIRDVAVFSSGIQVNGKMVLHSIIHDITEQKRAERALEEQLLFHKKILQTTRDGYWLIDGRGRFIEVNEAYCQMSGYTREEILQLSIPDVDVLEDPQATADHLRRIIANGFERFETRHRKKDGSDFFVEVSAAYLDAQGGQFICFCRDISERKQLENALNSRLVALTRPLDQPESVNFEDLFNLDMIQQLQDEFSAATGVASIITHPDGSPVTRPSNFCRLCQEIIRGTELGRANCFKSDSALGKPSPEGPIAQPCLSGGLWDAGASITVGGRHIASWLIGQVRDDAQEEDQMRAYAREIGADEADFMQAYREVPVMSQEKFRQVAQVLFTLTQQLSNMAYQNVQQARMIAAQKSAEAALRESEERLRLAGKATNDVIWDWDIPNNAQTWNEIGKTVFGWTEIVNEPQCVDWWLSRVHPDDRQRVDESFFAVIHNSAINHWHDEYRFLKADGTYADVMDRGYVIRDEHGKAIRMIGAMLNITERKRAETALRESEERFRKLSEDVPVCVCAFLPDSTLTYVNSTQAALSGLTPEQMIGRKFFDLLDSEYLALVQSKLAALTPEEPTEGHEQVHIQSDGSKHYVEWRNRAFFDDEGRVSYYLGVGLDVTKRKMIEDAMRREEEKTKNYLDIADVILIVVDQNQTISMINKKGLRLLGYEEDEIVGRNWFDLCLPQNQREQVKHVFNELMAGRLESVEYYENHVVTRSGEERLIGWHNTLIYGENGAVIGTLSSGEDITERKRMEEALRLSEERYRNIFNNSMEGIFQANSTGQYQIVNPAYARMFGYESPEEMISAVTNISSQLYVNPEDREKLFELLRSSGGRVKNFEVQLKRKDGTFFWVSINASLFQLVEQGSSILEGACIDITARKEAEKKVLEQLDELRRWHNITLGRENRILELKNEVNELLLAAGKPLRYASVTAETGFLPASFKQTQNRNPEGAQHDG